MHDRLIQFLKLTARFMGCTFAAAVVLWSGPLAGQSATEDETAATASQNATEQDEARTSRRPRRLGDSLAVDPKNEWVPGQDRDDRSAELTRKLSLGQRALADGDLLAPPNANAMEFFREALEIDPGNGAANAGIDQVADTLLNQARSRFAGGDYDDALTFLAAVARIRPGFADSRQLGEQVDRALQIASGLSIARERLAAGDLYRPAQENALRAFADVLRVAPDHPDAVAGLAEVTTQIRAELQVMLADGRFAAARELIDQALSQAPGNAALVAASADLEDALGQRWASQLEQLVTAIGNDELATAEQLLAQLLDSGYVGDTAPLLARIQRARQVLALAPGTVIQDQTEVGPGPRLLVLPRGNFMMGSARSERDRMAREGPQKNIVFRRPFAMALTEISVAQYGRFVSATGYVTQAEQGTDSSIYNVQTGGVESAGGMNWRLDFVGESAASNLPVIHVAQVDAQAFVDWLSRSSGHQYALPSEAQFEYALRGNTQSRFWWGNDEPDRLVENLTGSRDEFRSFDWPTAFRSYGDGYWGPAPVASFASNPFGIYDLGGNVLEWTADCFTPTLGPIPADGSPTVVPDCPTRSIRGGAWATPPTHSRSASRTGAPAGGASCLVGFRVVRAL